MEKIKDKILEEYDKGNIVVAGFDGLQSMPIIDFVKQPIEGILYDLNRSESVVLTFLPDPKWINDYAVAQVIRTLKARVDELEAVVPKHFYLSKKDPVLVYFKCKDKTGYTSTSHPVTAMKFNSRDEAADYNHKELYGEFEVTEY